MQTETCYKEKNDELEVYKNIYKLLKTHGVKSQRILEIIRLRSQILNLREKSAI